MSEPIQEPQQSSAVPVRKNPFKRIGCGIIVVLWFMVLLTPCFFIVIATQGEIAIQLGDIPGQSFRIWLINEARERGFAISRPVVQSSSDKLAACMQTDVSFLLWQGEGKPSEFCECFARSQPDSEWMPSESTSASCTP